MKVLLDECLDWRLRRDLPGHEVKTVQEMGWDGSRDGRLLALGAGGVSSLYHRRPQSVLPAKPVRLLHRGAGAQGREHSVGHTRPLMPKVLALLPSVQPGQVIVVD